jgi:putative transposase
VNSERDRLKKGAFLLRASMLPRMRRTYPTDLSDAEWTYLKAYLPAAPKTCGRPRMHHPREILNAIFYIVRGDCAWRLLPHDFPPWRSTVYHYFRAWRLDGT